MTTEQKLEKAIEALKFYSDRDNWVFSMSQGDKVKSRYFREISSEDTYGFEKNGHDHHFGGKVARTTLNAIGAF